MSRILVVDDDADVRELTVEVLRNGGYDVGEADRPCRALQMLAADHSVEVLVTDIVMPGLDGFELARRAVAMQPALKVLYVSGTAAGASARGGRALVPGPMLRKPYRISQLLQELARLVPDELLAA
jgi:two-component system, cell cycle response regulator CpdR